MLYYTGVKGSDIVKAVVQRVSSANVCVDGTVVGSIDKGYLLLVGICETDNEAIVKKVANKILDLRIFTDDQDKMNLGIEEIGGSVLSISQFTLYADIKKGKRPSFIKAAKPDVSKPLYDFFNKVLQERVHVQTGIFGADMKVSLLNDGPVTIVVDSEEL